METMSVASHQTLRVPADRLDEASGVLRAAGHHVRR
jgi:hypothetical protein